MESDVAAPVVIFGGTGGIGAAIARALVAQGQPVHLVARDAAKLSALCAELGCGSSVADVEDVAAVKAAVAAVPAHTHCLPALTRCGCFVFCRNPVVISFPIENG